MRAGAGKVLEGAQLPVETALTTFYIGRLRQIVR
jgi:hypothetical protein